MGQESLSINSSSSTTMSGYTLLRFFVGSRQAIIDIATCRGSLFLGGIFVLSTGFAREYDGEDLLHEPWHLLLPMVASLGTSCLLFFLLYMAARKHATTLAGPLTSFRHFLSLYWMTAPLAWIYAVPVEQFLSAGDAVQANLWFLGIVALWRVLLITRCASVLFGSSYLAAFFLVMLFADTLAMVILYFTPLPVFNIMGGIRLTESEFIIRETACAVQFFGVMALPIWFIASCVVIASAKRNWPPAQFVKEKTVRVSASLWALGGLSMFVWILVLPSSQPPQKLRRIVEEHLLNGQLELAIQEMSSHSRDEFPPHWDPPPRPGYGQYKPQLTKILQATTTESAAEWVKELYLNKFRDQMSRDFSTHYYWKSMGAENFEHYMTVFQDTTQLHEIVREHAGMFLQLLQDEEIANGTRGIQLRSLLETVGVKIPEEEVKPSLEQEASQNE